MAILNVGIDLAKNVFALHGVNELGQVDLRRPSVPRTKLHALVAALPPCTLCHWSARPTSLRWSMF